MTFKIVLAGDSDSGKTTFLFRHLTGEFKSPETTYTVKIHPISFQTNYGKININIWDCSDDFTASGKQYWENTDAFFVFFDLTKPDFLKTMNKWVNEITKHFGDKCPVIILCGSKCDKLSENQLLDKLKQIPRNKHYFTISSKTLYDYEKPFLITLRKLVNEQLYFTGTII